MPRIRTTKPEFWSSPDTASCDDPWARLLFMAMWNWADDSGRGTANAKELGGFAFPNEDWMTTDDIRRMLGGIRRAFGVKFYMVLGRPYFAIPSWDRHQKIDKRSGARHPAPEEGQDWDPETAQPFEQHQHINSEEFAESAPRARRISGAGTGEQGNRGTGEKEKDLSESDASEKTTPSLFEEFWNSYPRHDAKAAAKKAWPKAAKKLTPEQLVEQAARWNKLWTAAEQETRFIPHASVWLNGERWTDEEPKPRLRAVASHIPFQNPTDIDDYYAEL